MWLVYKPERNCKKWMHFHLIFLLFIWSKYRGRLGEKKMERKGLKEILVLIIIIFSWYILSPWRAGERKRRSSKLARYSVQICDQFIEAYHIKITQELKMSKMRTTKSTRGCYTWIVIHEKCGLWYWEQTFTVIERLWLDCKLQKFKITINSNQTVCRDKSNIKFFSQVFLYNLWLIRREY